LIIAVKYLAKGSGRKPKVQISKAEKRGNFEIVDENKWKRVVNPQPHNTGPALIRGWKTQYIVPEKAHHNALIPIFKQ
jgi:hypothetical protein